MSIIILMSYKRVVKLYKNGEMKCYCEPQPIKHFTETSQNDLIYQICVVLSRFKIYLWIDQFCHKGQTQFMNHSLPIPSVQFNQFMIPHNNFSLTFKPHFF